MLVCTHRGRLLAPGCCYLHAGARPYPLHYPGWASAPSGQQQQEQPGTSPAAAGPPAHTDTGGLVGSAVGTFLGPDFEGEIDAEEEDDPEIQSAFLASCISAARTSLDIRRGGAAGGAGPRPVPGYGPGPAAAQQQGWGRRQLQQQQEQPSWRDGGDAAGADPNRAAGPQGSPSRQRSGAGRTHRQQTGYPPPDGAPARMAPPHQPVTYAGGGQSAYHSAMAAGTRGWAEPQHHQQPGGAWAAAPWGLPHANSGALSPDLGQQQQQLQQEVLYWQQQHAQARYGGGGSGRP